jgi:hypothetical protein
MSFWIEGWVEIARAETTEPHSWQAVVRLGPLVNVADLVSESLFGLSKRVVSGEFDINPVAANRGVPGNVSTEVKRDVDAIAEHEREFGNGEFAGFTWARWSEVRSALSEDELSNSQWGLVFELIRRISERLQLSDEQVRVVVWCSW